MDSLFRKHYPSSANWDKFNFKSHRFSADDMMDFGLFILEDLLLYGTITYRGYTIERETDPWAIKGGFKYRWHIDEHIRGVKHLADAIDEIDEATETQYEDKKD